MTRLLAYGFFWSGWLLSATARTDHALMPLDCPMAARPDLKLDVTPLKAPLDKGADCLARAVTALQSFKDDLVQAIQWTLIGLASVITATLLNIIHLHGLARSKQNRSTP